MFLNTSRLPMALYNGRPLHQDERDGVYFVGVQEVYRPDPANPKRSVSAFLRAVASEEATAAYSAQVTSGLIYKGICQDRPNDWIGFGVGQTTPNPRLVNAVALDNVFSKTSRKMPTQERFLEAFYSIDVADDVVIPILIDQNR